MHLQIFSFFQQLCISICNDYVKKNSETRRLVQNVILKLEKCKATLSAIASPFRNILFVYDEAFQCKPYETSVLLYLENCSVFR